MKTCKKCGIEKELGEFGKNKANKDEIKSYCKSCEKEYNKEWRENNKEKINEGNKEWRENNKEKMKEYQSNRRSIDPLFKLTGNIRNLIGSSFRKNGYSKSSKTYDILGCSFEEFKQHIEDQFEEWMDWSNQGLYDGITLNYGWDIDHIIPLSSASTDEEVIKLNHYTNLQPLCSKINRDIKRDLLDF